MNRRGPRLARGVVPSLVAVGWISAVAIGFGLVHRHERTPGPGGPSPDSWPSGPGLARVEGVPNVLMAVHPKCPCTRSSLALLARIVRRSPAGASVRLLVYRPSAGGEGWEVPPSSGPDAGAGIGRVADPGGVEAERFGLGTSGAVIAFDADGRRQFAGGLNATRGGEEFSDGGPALLAVLGRRPPPGPRAEVYGCPLLAPGARDAPGRGP